MFLNSSTLLLLNTSCPVLANSVDPYQLASEDARAAITRKKCTMILSRYQTGDTIQYRDTCFVQICYVLLGKLELLL